MNIFRQLALVAALAGSFTAMSAMAQEMKKDDATTIQKEDSTMTEQDHQIPYTTQEFARAQESGKPFFVAFHKKWCAVCAAQKLALRSVYKDPAAKDLKVLVVDYDNDTESLKKFNVGQQSELILFKGDKEISRSNGLVRASSILNQAKI